MSNFKREPRYVVLKIKDVEEYLTINERRALIDLSGKIADGRYREGRPPLNAVVVERDWPEFDVVWGMIEARMLGVKNKYETEIEEIQTELSEQCRLLGMSAERELTLNTQIQHLISERVALGLAIDRAISGIVPDEHPLRSRLVEIAALHAKFETMRKQEPVAWQMNHPSLGDGWIDTNEAHAEWLRDNKYGEWKVRPLYLAPGAQEK